MSVHVDRARTASFCTAWFFLMTSSGCTTSRFVATAWSFRILLHASCARFSAFQASPNELMMIEK